jgi:hypothetical protein
LIVAAPGIYSQKTNVVYYKTILISGPWDQNGDCIDRSAVVVDDRIDGAGQTAIFWAQDHATLRIYCITLAAYTNGSIGFAFRQFAIGDVNDVDFKNFRGGLGVNAAETSKVAILNAGIYGDASQFVKASDLSQITIVGTLTVGRELRFDAFLTALSNSVVLVCPSKLIGGETMSGASYQCRRTSLFREATFLSPEVKTAFSMRLISIPR